jgi:predicted nucleic acid-binding Zn ribbon protein
LKHYTDTNSMSGTNDHSLKELLNDLLKEYQLADKLNELKLTESWPKVVGKVIAKHTTGIYFRDKKLYVTLDNAAVREELQYAKTKLLKSLNKLAGENFVDEIFFK